MLPTILAFVPLAGISERGRRFASVSPTLSVGRFSVGAFVPTGPQQRAGNVPRPAMMAEKTRSDYALPYAEFNLVVDGRGSRRTAGRLRRVGIPDSRPT